jgi:hypothetical protein
MRALLFAPALLLLLAAAAVANPYPEMFLYPMDEMEYPRLVGIPDGMVGDPPGRSPHSEVTITLLNWGEPAANAFVEVVINPACTGVRICEGAVLSGFTDENGQLTLNMALGGCCDLPQAVFLEAWSIRVRELDMIVSPDWDQAVGNGSVGLPDFVAFGNLYVTGQGGCTDYTGDGLTDISDFIIFSTGGWGRMCTTRDLRAGRLRHALHGNPGGTPPPDRKAVPPARW